MYRQDPVFACVEISQCVGCITKSFLGDGVAALAPSSGEEAAPPRHRAGVASMAWRSTRRFRMTRRKFDFHTGTRCRRTPRRKVRPRATRSTSAKSELRLGRASSTFCVETS